MTAAVSRARWMGALIIIAAGLPGVFSILLATPDIPGVPRLALVINPLIMLVVLTAVGAALAPKLGFRSRLYDHALRRSPWPSLWSWLGPARVGLGLGVILALADWLTVPVWRGASAQPPDIVEGWTPHMLAAGLLYGGITEEIMIRFGLMSLLTWLAAWLLRRSSAPLAAAAWTGNVAAALFFGILHLPAVALTGAEITSGIAARTILLNAIGGLTYGWFFMRQDLESAMVAHGATHLGFAVAALAVSPAP